MGCFASLAMTVLAYCAATFFPYEMR